MKKPFGRLAAILSLTHALLAHDLYLMPQKFRAAVGESVLLSVHTGDSFPLSEQPVDPARLQSQPALADDAWRILGKATHATVPLRQAGGHLFAVYTTPRLLTLAGDKFTAYLHEEGLASALALRAEKKESSAPGRELYAKFAKTYVSTGTASGAYRQPVGLKIEFVPQADPAQLRAGDQLPLLVLYNGRPLAGVQVEVAVSTAPQARSEHRIAGRTDSQGRLSVPLPTAGRVRLHCVHMERVSTPTHDWESFWASLTFEVSPLASSFTSAMRKQ